MSERVPSMYCGKHGLVRTPHYHDGVISCGDYDKRFKLNPTAYAVFYRATYDNGAIHYGHYHLFFETRAEAGVFIIQTARPGWAVSGLGVTDVHFGIAEYALVPF